jgi:hypothetical protein
VSDELGISDRDISKALILGEYEHKRTGWFVQKVRALANERFAHREIVVAKDDHGNELGHTTRQNPERKSRVTDMAALMGHLQDENPDALEDVDVVRAGVTDAQVMAVLRAAGLTDVEVRVREVELNFLLKKSVRDKAPAAPGIEVYKPVGTTNVYPAKEQTAAIEAALAAGELSRLIEGDR